MSPYLLRVRWNRDFAPPGNSCHAPEALLVGESGQGNPSVNDPKLGIGKRWGERISIRCWAISSWGMIVFVNDLLEFADVGEKFLVREWGLILPT